MTTKHIHIRAISKEVLGELPIVGFENAAAFGAWLADAPRTSKGIWLKLAKKRSTLISLSRPEAIDAALCHGWIDGQQDKYDEASWLVRFTPRRRASRWSQINRARATNLIADGLMHPAGLAEVEAARADGRWEAAYAPASTALVPPDFQTALDQSPKAAEFFAVAGRSNRYAMIYRLSAAKRLATRLRLIAEFAAMCGRRQLLCGEVGGNRLKLASGYRRPF